MFFFVNQYLLSNNSSIEHAEIKRLKLFKENHVPAKLVTQDFDPILSTTLSRFKLDRNQVINMFDFFAGTTDYQGKGLHVEDLHLPFDYQVSAGNNSRTVKDGQRLVAKIFFAGGTVGIVHHVDYYDVAGNITLRQTFDLRGFKAVDAFFGQTGKIHYERYYNPKGVNYLDRYYIQSTQNTPINSLNVLKGYKGHNYYFDGIDWLFNFFLQQLDQSIEGENSFIADRPNMAIQPVLSLRSSAKKYLYLPFNHIPDGQNQKNGPLNSLIANALTINLKQWNGIIVSTQKQHDDLQKRIGDQVPIYVINSTPVNKQERVPMSQRLLQQVIYVGRLGNDKQTNQLINIFIRIHKKLKNSHIILYGYGTPDDTKAYKEQIKKAGLEGNIILAGYTPELDEKYNQSQLFIDASRTDSQPLAVGEALSHGVPVVSYEYPYGPDELIQSGVNGRLIPLNDEKRFVKVVTKLLNDTPRLQELSDGAYDNIKRFDSTTTWQQWEQLINAK